jgi:hypothetical protein
MSNDDSDDSENEELEMQEKINTLSVPTMYERSIKYFNSEKYLKSANEKHYFHENININFEHNFCDMLKLQMHQGGGADFAMCYNDAREYTDQKIYYDLQKYYTNFHDLLRAFTDYHDNEEYMVDGKFDLDTYHDLMDMYSDKNIDMLMKLLEVAKQWIDNGHDVFLVTFELVNESVTYNYVYKVLDIKKHISHMKWCCSAENYSKQYIKGRRFDFFKVFIRKNQTVEVK